VVHCDGVSMTRSCMTMCYCSLETSDFRSKVYPYLLSFVVFWRTYMLYLSRTLSRFGAVTIYPCVGSKGHPALYSANLGMSRSYTLAEGNKQAHGLVCKPSRCLPEPAQILSPRWYSGKLLFTFPAEKAHLGSFCLDFPLLLGGNGMGTGRSDVCLKCNTRRLQCLVPLVAPKQQARSVTRSAACHVRRHPIECVEECQCNSDVGAGHHERRHPVECIASRAQASC
jgi:hypothetical protein